MIYDLYAGATNQDLHHTGTSRMETYTLLTPDGKPYPVTRDEKFNYSHFRYNQYPVTLRAVYDTDRFQIGNTIGFNFDQSPIAEMRGNLTYNSDIAKDYSYSTKQPYTTKHFIWSGTYYFMLPGDFQLSLTPRANWGHTDYSYLYRNSLSENNLIDNTSKENYYRLSTGASLYKSLSECHSIFTNLYGGTNRNKVRYSGSSHYTNDFSDSYAGARIGYNFTNRKWKFESNIALQWEQNSINGNAVNELYPLINISGQYSPNGHNSIRTFFHYGANYPGESVKTPNVLQENELLYKTGNPDLPLSRQVTLNLQYNHVANNNISFSLYAQYYGERYLYVPVFETYANGDALLKTYSSDQNYNRTQAGVSANLKFLDGNLQLAFNPSVTLFDYKGYYNITRNPLSVNSSLTYYLNRVFFQLSYQTATATLQGNRGVWYRTRDFYQLQTGWGNSSWTIRISAINMFRGDWRAATQSLNSPLYSETLLQGGTYYHRRINFSVTYTFGYGKKVNRGNEVGEQSGAASAILK